VDRRFVCVAALITLAFSTIDAWGQAAKPTLQAADISSYEGRNVSSVELAGQPELKLDDLMPLVKQRPGEPFSPATAEETIAALKARGEFQDVQLDLRPEPEGVRVSFLLQPALYFGMYKFTGADQFSYSRLLQISNYSSQQPFSPVDVQRAEISLRDFFRRSGYFQARVESEVETDKPHGLANVVFHVTLNRLAKFGDVTIEGTSPEQAQNLHGSLGSIMARVHRAAVRPGKNYSFPALQNATGYLEGKLTKRDHLAAQVQLAGANYNPETNRADVTFNVNPGPLVHVNVEGAHLWPWTKRRLLPLYQESGLGPELIQEGRQNLVSYFKSNGFFDVQVDADVQDQSDDGQTVLYRITKGDRKMIEDVKITGNQHLTTPELLGYVTSHKANWLGRTTGWGWLSHGKYDEGSVKNLRAVYQNAGFSQVKVTPQLTNESDNVVVTYVVEEGPRDFVDSLRVEGNRALSIAQFAPKGLKVQPGQPYAQRLIDEDRSQIIARYLELGFLTASLEETAEPLPDDEHRFQVVYTITEGPQVQTNSIVTLGRERTVQQLINKNIRTIQPGKPLTQSELLRSESQLYTIGIFDWAQIDPRQQITNQNREDVIVKVHEGKRNTMTYGVGFELVNRGGNVPSGTAAVPGLPPVGLPSNFKTSQSTTAGPRGSILYTRNNVRGRAESITLSGLAGPLNRRASFVFTEPNFRWTDWTSSLTASAEINKQNPLFNLRQGQVGLQLDRPLDRAGTKHLFLRYSISRSGLRDLLLPELVPQEDLHTRLSTFSVIYTRDTRDNTLDAHKGIYQSFELDVNPGALGSSVSFAKLLGQTAYYRDIHSGIIWANSLRIGLEEAFAGSHVPISEKFFTGGGSTLRGFPLNGAGPQRTVLVCGNPSDFGTCAFIPVPAGGTQMLILNSEFRIPVPIKKGLSVAAFYDGGNVYDRVGFRNFWTNYTHSVGFGLRYATPVGPVRIDIGHNLSGLQGIKPSGFKANQIFITLGQAF
jgi:outer membrane protein insertion porin family